MKHQQASLVIQFLYLKQWLAIFDFLFIADQYCFDFTVKITFNFVHQFHSFQNTYSLAGFDSVTDFYEGFCFR